MQNIKNKLIHLSEVDSTNSYLRTKLENSVEELTAVWADFQTAGRGQKGNKWESELGKNLSFSTVLYPTFVEPVDQFIISQIVSLAVKRTLSRYLDNVTVKWPNDIYWNNRKICGILIENDLSDNHILRSIVGVGLNVNQSAFISDAPNPISMKQITGEEYDRENLLSLIIEELCSLNLLARTEKEAIASEYLTSLYRREGFYPYEDEEGEFKAEVVNVESSGLYVLKTSEGDIRKYAFKEVRFL